MDINQLILNGHGQFVWPAFIFTFLCCFFLYSKTMKEFKKQEKIFLNEFKELKTVKEKVAKNKENAREVWSASSI